jgi:anti-sigma factor RsiW
MHTTDEDLLRYVSDDLPEAQAQAIEAHVQQCASCQGRLQQQAALETFCSDLGAQLQLQHRSASPRPERSALRRSLGRSIASLASLVLIWLPGHGRTPAPFPAARVRILTCDAPALPRPPTPEHDAALLAKNRPPILRQVTSPIMAIHLRTTSLLSSLSNIDAGLGAARTASCAQKRQC